MKIYRFFFFISLLSIFGTSQDPEPDYGLLSIVQIIDLAVTDAFEIAKEFVEDSQRAYLETAKLSSSTQKLTF